MIEPGQLAKLPAAEWLKLLRADDLSVQELEKFSETLETVQSELPSYIEDKREQGARAEEITICREVSQKGYTYRTDVVTDGYEPEAAYIDFLLLPVNVSLPDNLVTQNSEYNQKVKAAVINLETQTVWMRKISLLAQGDILACKLGECSKIFLAENKDLTPIYQTRIRFYYPHHLLEINQQYLIITEEGEVFDCNYRNGGFYYQNELLLQINLQRMGHEPISNFSHFHDSSLHTWHGHKTCCYCIIPDPAIR